MASAGRPPGSRPGEPIAVTGRLVVAGVGSHQRSLSPRASQADLWASLDSIASHDGIDRIQRVHGVSLDRQAVRRTSSYLHQAQEYYAVIATLDPVAKPLLAYYFILNLTKAFLTIQDPASTAGKIGHGASDAFSATQRYRFTQEKTKIQRDGVLPQLARRSGQGYCWPGATELQVSRMIAYVTEGADLYSDALGEKPKLIPVNKTIVRSSGVGAAREAWLKVDVARLSLKEQGLTAKSLLDSAKIFDTRFRLVHDEADESTVTYESRTAHTYSRVQSVLPLLRAEFDRSLILRNRSRAGGVDYLVLSQRPNLLSMEALTFAVVHHLSNMVRYRPHHVESLRGGRYWWLFTSWVDRACENFLLSMASRISIEEHAVE